MAIPTGAGRIEVERNVHRIVVEEVGGRKLRRFVVDCPRGRSKDLTVCGRCPDCRGYTLRGTQGSTIVCTLFADEEVAGAAPGTVGAAMRRDVVCVAPEVPLGDVLDLLADPAQRGVAVLDEADRPIGLLRPEHGVGLDDPARWAPVRTVMAGGVLTARESDPLLEVRARMRAAAAEVLVVVDEERRILGVLDAADP